MKNIIFILTLLLSVACGAQNTISLEQAAIYNKSDDGLPDNISYVKDINNRLNQFVGTWKGSFGGKNYEFRFVKKLQFGEYSVKWDEIIGRAIIKDINGNIIYTSINQTDNRTGLRGVNFQNNSYVMNFTGNTDCMDYGTVFLEISKTNPNQMIFYFHRSSETFDPAKCPNFTTYKTILPQEKFILTKQ